jgi:drug/metabolite transporter (DMT)-like permease
MVPPSKTKLILAFIGLYLIWSSTYLGIKICVAQMPPFAFAAARNILAGVLVLLAARAFGVPWPAWREIRPAAVMGLFLFVGGNGGVAWGLQRGMPSGVAALLVGTTPFWMVLVEWAGHRERKLGGWADIGLLVGFLGVAVLADPTGSGGAGLDPWAVLVVVLSAVSWSWGSVWGPRQKMPDSAWMTSGFQMLAGGLGLGLAALLSGECGPGAFSRVTPQVWAVFLYLVFFGTIVGFTCFYYVLKNTQPHVASSYAYVNPVLAVFLGWIFLGEAVTWRVWAAGALIVPAVLLMTLLPMKQTENQKG